MYRYIPGKLYDGHPCASPFCVRSPPKGFGSSLSYTHTLYAPYPAYPTNLSGAIRAEARRLVWQVGLMTDKAALAF